MGACCGRCTVVAAVASVLPPLLQLQLMVLLLAPPGAASRDDILTEGLRRRQRQAAVVTCWIFEDDLINCLCTMTCMIQVWFQSRVWLWKYEQHINSALVFVVPFVLSALHRASHFIRPSLVK